MCARYVGNFVCVSIHNDLISRSSDLHPAHEETEAQRR